jgi:gamma-F420-2:alpha-L-glutamate ligase
MERRAADGGFKANFSTGGTVLEFVPDDEAIDLAIRTAQALNIQVAGIDLLFTEDGRYTICEANTFPGFRGLEMACKVNVPQAIFSAMQRRVAQKRGEAPVVRFEELRRREQAGE